MVRVRRVALGIVLLLALLMGLWLLPAAEADNAPRGGVALARHLLRLGLTGTAPQPMAGYNPIVGEQLEPGDVLVTRSPGSVYGYWSHATVYLGAGQVLGHDLLRGIFVEDIEGFASYERVLVLRPGVTARQQAAVVAFSRDLVGRPFHLAAHPRDPRQWSCAKAALAAWASVGVSVGDGRFWPTPDALAAGSAPVVADLRINQGPP